jgi:hypothetical protein
MLDPRVTDWPAEEALGFAKMAIKCVELRRTDRPDLGKEIMPELNRLRELADINDNHSIFSGFISRSAQPSLSSNGMFLSLHIHSCMTIVSMSFKFDLMKLEYEPMPSDL